MRLITSMLVSFALAAPALADGWKQYADPTYAFAVSFPGDPQVETTTYTAPDGRSVPARVYSVTQETGSFKMTVADLSDTITVLTRGRVLAEGNYVAISNNAEVREAYLGVGHA